MIYYIDSMMSNLSKWLMRFKNLYLSTATVVRFYLTWSQAPNCLGYQMKGEESSTKFYQKGDSRFRCWSKICLKG